MVIGDMIACRHGHRTGGAVDGRDLARKPQIDAVGLIECGRAQQQAGEIALALEPRLGERRTLVRRHRFRADQRDRSLPAILTQQRSHGAAGVSGPDNHRPGGCVAHAGSLGIAL